MKCAWASRPKAANLVVLMSLLAVCAAPFAAARQAAKPRPAASPRQIILPPKLLAGAQATLAVLDTQGRLLSGAEVQLPEGQRVTTDSTGRAMFQAMSQPGMLVARLSSGQIATTAMVVSPGRSASAPGAAEGSPAAKLVSYRRVLAIHDRFSLQGTGFRPAADANHVYLNGDPCLVVASSPLGLVALPGPGVPVGDVTLHVTAGGADAGQFPVSAVLLEFIGPAEVPNAGATGKLIVRARGTTEPLQLEVRNSSPAVIQLSQGNVQRLKTSGGEENIAPVEMKFVSDGNYSVSARLVQPEEVRAR